MSRIDKLGVQGIRSFGPNDLKKIEFFSPLTLILGQNGCGKTTIIESLKYLTTGEVPPGCGKGVSFVHDPKMANENSVRGQVRMLFQNIKGETVTAIRSLEVTSKGKKYELKTLDATMSVTSVDGVKSQITSKCADFQELIGSYLGVAKPILENVIFCHQEDSTWPLDEGKKVKEKFDSIFNATKYIKCLETIRKLRIHIKDMLKGKNLHLGSLKALKEEVTEKRRKLENVKKEIKGVEEDKEKCILDLKKLKLQHKDLTEALNSYYSLEIDKASKENRLAELKKDQEYLKSDISERFTGSDSELKEKIENFESDLLTQQNSLTLKRNSIGRLEDAMKKENKEKLLVTDQISDLEADYAIYKSNEENLKLLLRGLVAEYNIAEYNELSEKVGTQDILDSVSLKIQSLEKLIEGEETKRFDEDKKLENNINNKKSELDMLLYDIKANENAAKTLSCTYDECKQKFRKNKMYLEGKNCHKIQEDLIGIKKSIELQKEKLNEKGNKHIEKVQFEKSRLYKEKASFETKVEEYLKQIENKEKFIKDNTRKLEEVCPRGNLDEVLIRTKECTDKLKKESSDLASSLTALYGFVDKLKSRDCCPLCHRDFKTKQETNQLISELENKIIGFPDRLQQSKIELRKGEQDYQNILQLKPVQQQIMNAKNEMNKLEEDRQSSLIVLENVKECIDAEKEKEKELTGKRDKSLSLNSYATLLDSSLANVSRLEENLKRMKQNNKDSVLRVDKTELVSKQREIQNLIDSKDKQIENIQMALKLHNEKLYELSNKERDLLHKKSEFDKIFNETEMLSTQITKAENEKLRVELECCELREKLKPIEVAIKSMMNERELVSEKNKKYLKDKQNELYSIKENLNKTNEVYENILEFSCSKKSETIEKNKEKLKRINGKINEYEYKKKELTDEMQELSRLIFSQTEIKRNFRDELLLREKIKESNYIQKKIQLLEHQMNEVNFEKLSEESSEISKDIRSLDNKIGKFEGNAENYYAEEKELEHKLNTKSFTEAEVAYKSKFIEIKCEEVAMEDLNKYYKALDTAIMKFHSERMHAINTIIKELWRNTYRGNDIDYIQIKTDETESQGADKRRTYNYRVVMVKTDTEMDMRGRCSAGQKVLASLIIRMALAETFSAKCGVLALDEPTTNLDRDNIDALSLALLDIVNKRSHQKNFQLIVITHDDEFLEKLTRADYIEYYYRVSRDERGLSKITKRPASLI